MIQQSCPRQTYSLLDEYKFLGEFLAYVNNIKYIFYHESAQSCPRRPPP
jgi:hypothetical protein